MTDWYDDFAFHKIYQRVNQFCIVDLSAFYFDVLKDRLYISAPEIASGRRSAQTAIWRIGEALVRLLAPIMSFTTRRGLGITAETTRREESVHLAQFIFRRRILWASFSDENASAQQRRRVTGLDYAPFVTIVLQSSRGSAQW